MNKWIKQIAEGNRFYWVLAAIAFPLFAAFVGTFFAVGCRCVYGSARASAYYTVINIIWARLGIGLILG